jgi:hypothetical protein
MTSRFPSFGVLTLSLAAAACSNTMEGANPAGGPNAGSSGTAQGGSGNGAGTGGVGNNSSGGVGNGAGTSGAAGTSAGTSGVAGTGGGGINVSPATLNLNGSPAYYRVVRLTNEQWTNSVQSVLRLTARPTNAEAFQNAVSGTTDFTNNELVLDVDSRRWSDYQTAAQALANQVTSDAALLRNVYPGTDSAGFITTVGQRFYRRPLTPAEAARYQTIYTSGSMMTGTKSAFAKGVSVVLETMMQSPNFLYRTELGAPNAPLSNYEMAAKLSLLFRNVTPDDALLQAAANGGSLDTADGVALTVQQMLEESAAVTVMRQFHGEFLHFDRFSELSKFGVANYNPAINAELAESSYLFFNRIFTQGLGVADIFRSTVGFVGPNMAPLYAGITATPGTLAERDLGANRAGYFTQLPFLMLHAHNADPDAIHRGVSMVLDALCAPLGPAAADIPPLPMFLAGQTNRERVDEHTRACGSGCHNAMINPMGFAFENFDGMGQYRETETNPVDMAQLPIDSSGTFEFVDGEKSWQNGAELMNLLGVDPQTHLCYSKKLSSFALQRDIVAADIPLLSELASVSTSTTGSVKQVIVDLVKNDAFRNRAAGLP